MSSVCHGCMLPFLMCRYRENADGTRTRIWQTRTSGIGHRIKLGTFGRLKMTNRNGVKKWATGALKIGLSPKLTVKNNGRVEIGRLEPCYRWWQRRCC